MLKLIKNRKRLFVSEGGQRTEAWKEEKRRVDNIIKERKRGYMDMQRSHLLAKDAGRNFFKHVRNFASFEWPKRFNVKSLLPDMDDMAAAEKLAGYFNKVSRELEPHQITV